MNARGILDQLMKQAGGSAAKGSGTSVENLLQSLSSQFGAGQTAGGGQSAGAADSFGGGVDLKSLLGGGAVGLLIGSKRGRKMGKKVLKYGAIAGVGALAWKAWQNHQASQGGPAAGAGTASAAPAALEGERVELLEGQAREQRSLEILQAMIMAARADGHIDEAERSQLTEQIDALGADPELHAWVERQLSAPLDAEALARQADSPQAAREIYLVSAAIVDEQNAMERAWLDHLAQALKLEPELARELERQVGAGG
jgi:uncharacterized membrane protein YebE (DUF533 family)